MSVKTGRLGRALSSCGSLFQAAGSANEETHLQNSAQSSYYTIKCRRRSITQRHVTDSEDQFTDMSWKYKTRH